MPEKRQKISKKARFEVFKRDQFTCVYCGQTPPKVVLHVDHVEPISKGGTNDINNLVTSCSDCNLGKGATPLSSVPSSLVETAESLREKEEQLREYRKLIAKINRRKNKDIEDYYETIRRIYYGKQVATK